MGSGIIAEYMGDIARSCKKPQKLYTFQYLTSIFFLATELYDDHKCCIILPSHERTFPHSLHLMYGMLYTNVNVILVIIHLFQTANKHSMMFQIFSNCLLLFMRLVINSNHV